MSTEYASSAVVGRDRRSRRARSSRVPSALDVLVEQHLLRRRRRRARPAAVDRVLLALDRARVVLPRAVGHRRRDVGLLDAALDLLEDPVAERRVGASSASVYAFSASRCASTVGVVAVAQPVPVVDALVAVLGRGRCGRRRGARRSRRGHRRRSLETAGADEERRPLRCVAPCRPTIDADSVHAEPSSTRSRTTPTASSPAIVQEAGTNQVLMFALDEPRGARAHARRPAAPGSGAAAARSTGARARRRATGSTSARRTTTATWTSSCSSSSRRDGGRATRASGAASSARSASGATPGPV